MLLSLAIRDVVLIDRLDLSFRPGLCVLTGETGAGKSILLDALGLALGVRAESGLVRQGAEQASVAAEFALPKNHPAHALLKEAGLAADGDGLVLRRIVAADGRSRAFVDDQPASVSLLRQLGEALVEIEGQFAQRGLLDPATHREALDAYGVAPARQQALASGWTEWRERNAARDAAAARLQSARAEEEFLRHALREIDALEPKPGEETALAEERALLMNKERLSEALDAVLGELGGERGAGGAGARGARGARSDIRDRDAGTHARRRCEQPGEERGAPLCAPGARAQAQCGGRRPGGPAPRHRGEAGGARRWRRRARRPDAGGGSRAPGLYEGRRGGIGGAAPSRRQARPGRHEGIEAAEAREGALHDDADGARRG